MTTEPEDILASSLETLYDYAPIVHSSAGSDFVYTAHLPSNNTVQQPRTNIVITLGTPDTEAQNWALHASSIWVSSIFIADHISELEPHLIHNNTDTNESRETVTVLELGAGAGLPSILLAKAYPQAHVVCTDYPDAAITQTLHDNVKRNKVHDRCIVVPYAWGTDPAPLLVHAPNGFDCILAADTLWNLDLHAIFIDTLQKTLSKSRCGARAHLVAGLHTGRYTIESFLKLVRASGLAVVDVVEREVGGEGKRVWDVERAEREDERERRRWVIWIKIGWASSNVR
jgi:EEF1A N-terminal glycine/lysine methyltransferase